MRASAWVLIIPFVQTVILKQHTPSEKKTDLKYFPLWNHELSKKKEDGNGITVLILPASTTDKNEKKKEKERKETDTESLQL